MNDILSTGNLIMVALLAALHYFLVPGNIPSLSSLDNIILPNGTPAQIQMLHGVYFAVVIVVVASYLKVDKVLVQAAQNAVN